VDVRRLIYIYEFAAQRVFVTFLCQNSYINNRFKISFDDRRSD